MSQQHAQFEEEFRDGPPSYQSGYTGPQPVSYTVNVPPLQSYTNLPGQKLLVPDLNTGRAPSPGQRLALAIVSLVFVFVIFMIAVGVSAATSYPVAGVAIIFALVFTVFTIIINLIFSRRH